MAGVERERRGCQEGLGGVGGGHLGDGVTFCHNTLLS